MMRVLHVIGAMDRGGAETMIMNLYRAIDRERIQFDFLVHEERACDYDEEIRSLGGRIYRAPRFNGANCFAYKRIVGDLIAEHDEWSVVHGHIGSSAAIYLSEARRAGRVTIAHSHAQNYIKGLPGLAFSLMSRPTRRIADWFLGCSIEACVDRFGENIAHGDRCFVLRNGIDLPRYAFDETTRGRMRSSLGLGAKEPVFCHVGRLTEVKNHAFLLDVFSRVKAEAPDAVLLLAGRGELEDELRRDVEARGLTDAVRFLGVRDDICDVLQAADVFVFPSRNEGLAIAVVEAQASGLPCLVSTGVPDVAIMSKAAQRVDLADGAESWARRAIDLASHLDCARRPEGAREVRAAGFGIEESARWLEGFYRDIAR